MYSTGTDFYKLLDEAHGRKERVNTAAEIAEHAKDLVESWTPIHVLSMTLKGSEMAMVVEDES